MSVRGRRAAVPFVLVTVFLDVLGVGLIIPVLPALVAEFAPQPDLQAYWYGALVAGYGLAQFLAGPLIGALSDRVGRRPVLLVCLFGLALHFALIALAPSLLALLGARLLGGAAAATIPVANAYVADLVSEKDRARGFGQVGAMFGLGFIVGPIAGGLLGDVDLRWPFHLAAALALLNAAYGLVVLPESLARGARTPFTLSRANPFVALRSLARTPGAGRPVLVFALLGFAQFMLHSTWVLVTAARFGWGPREAGLSLFVVGVVAVLMQGVFLGPLIERFGERRLAVIGMCSGALAFVGYAALPEGWMMYPVILANLLGFAAVPSLQALISKSFEASRQGLVMGSLASINGVMLVLAPLAGTALFAQVAHLPASDLRLSASFFVGAVLQGAAALLAARGVVAASALRG
ncbi:MAG: MFS transporter [Burkholderiaceae bacterium]|nr:MFS transporter [Burkholderiaceae bacterium]